MNNKVSVIIPTLLLNTKILNKLLFVLNNDAAVGEILLINNSAKNFKPKKNIQKLKIFNQKKNLFVNPSWNFGIEQAENDIFLIINDDIICPEKFCSSVINSAILENDNTGLVGFDNLCIKQYNRLIDKDMLIPICDNISNIVFNIYNNVLYSGNWGSAFFGKTKNYHKIPDDLKLFMVINIY